MVLDMAKPHKGRISNWREQFVGAPNDHENVTHLGYYITGMFIGHPRFGGKHGHTSMVVKREGNEIETYNSRYTLAEHVRQSEHMDVV